MRLLLIILVMCSGCATIDTCECECKCDNDSCRAECEAWIKGKMEPPEGTIIKELSKGKEKPKHEDKQDNF